MGVTTGNIRIGPVMGVYLKTYVATGAIDVSGGTDLGGLDADAGCDLTYRAEWVDVEVGRYMAAIDSDMIGSSADIKFIADETMIENIARFCGMLATDVGDDTVNDFKYLRVGKAITANYYHVYFKQQRKDDTSLYDWVIALKAKIKTEEVTVPYKRKEHRKWEVTVQCFADNPTDSEATRDGYVLEFREEYPSSSSSSSSCSSSA